MRDKKTKVSVEYTSGYLLMTIHDVTSEGYDIEMSIDWEHYIEMYITDGDEIVEIPDVIVLKDTRRVDKIYDVVKEQIESDDDERIRRFCEYLNSEYEEDLSRVYYDSHFDTVVFVSSDLVETEFDISEFDDFDQ